jgi:hypothetical protein
VRSEVLGGDAGALHGELQGMPGLLPGNRLAATIVSPLARFIEVTFRVEAVPGLRQPIELRLDKGLRGAHGDTAIIRRPPFRDLWVTEIA